jgi:hypothetical protein
MILRANSIDQLIFVMVMVCVFLAVRPEYLNIVRIIKTSFALKRLKRIFKQVTHCPLYEVDRIFHTLDVSGVVSTPALKRSVLIILTDILLLLFLILVATVGIELGTF